MLSLIYCNNLLRYSPSSSLSVFKESLFKEDSCEEFKLRSYLTTSYNKSKVLRRSLLKLLL